MKKTLHLLVFLLAMATVVALAQSGSSTTTQSNGPAWGPPSTPASQSSDKNKSLVDDSTLTTQIQQQLSSDPALKNVKASVSNGTVDLEGTVASKADKKHAKQVVASIPGVRKVHDHLTINANATAQPGSNEPTPASAGTAGSTGAAASGNTAGSIAGNAGAASTTSQTPTASSTTPQTPSASAGATTTAMGGSSTAANGMPQSDVSPGSASSASGTMSPSASSTATTSPQASSAGTAGTSAGAAATVPQTSTTGSAGTSGSTSATTPQTPTPDATGTTGAATTVPQGQGGSATSSAGTSLGDLQHMVNTAFRHEPVLANDHLNAIVSGDQIVVMGNVASGKERQTALRIAQSFAGNRRVVDRMTVNGQSGATTGSENQTGVSGGTPATGTNGTGNTGANPSSTPTNPTASPDSTNNPRR